MEAYDALYPSLHLLQFMDDYYGVYHLDANQQSILLNLFHNIRHALSTRNRNYKIGIDLDILSWLFKLMEYVRRQHQETPLDSDNPKYKAAYMICPNTVTAPFPWKNCPGNFS